MAKLAIIGASGHGKVVAELAMNSGYGTIHFYDDNWPRLNKNLAWPITGNIQKLIDGKHQYYDGVVVAIGNNKARAQIVKKLQMLQLNLPNLIHPTAFVSRFAQLGAATVVLPNATVHTSAQLGDGVIINTSSTIEHDCKIDNYAHISPNATLAGNVIVKEKAWIGIGAMLRQGTPDKPLIIGENAVVGMGAVVTKDVPPNTTVVGNPARPLHKP